MEVQKDNELLETLKTQFFTLDKVSRQKFLRYIVMMPDLAEKKEIKLFLDGLYLANNDDDANIAEDLFKSVFTIEKVEKCTFVEYLTSQLNTDDTAFVFELLNKAEDPKNEEMELEEKGEEIGSREETLVDDNAIDLIKNNEVQKENELLESLKNQFFNLDKVNRQKFLRYTVMMPDLAEKKEIELFLDVLYFENNDDDDKIAEDLFKSVFTLEKVQKFTFVECLTSQLNPEDTAFVFELLNKTEETKNEETKLGKNGGELNSHQKKLVDDNSINLNRNKDVRRDFIADLVEEDLSYCQNNPISSNYFENDTLLIKKIIKRTSGKSDSEYKINTKSNNEYKINTKSNNVLKINRKVDYELKIDTKNSEKQNVDNLHVKSEKREYVKVDGYEKDSKPVQNPNDFLKPSRESMFQCEFCCVGTISKELLQLHLEKSHTDAEENAKVQSNSTICEICSKQFRAPSMLKYHIVTHSEERPFPCDKCNKKFKTTYQVNVHKNGVHNETRNVCEECPKTFSTNAILQHHIKSFHTGDNINYDFQCEKCSKQFRKKSTLKRHEFVHRESKDFVCEKCSKSFRSAQTLKIHGYIHGEKAYRCHQCNKEFYLLGNFKTHERVHNGEKPYVCDVCEKAFVQKGNLKSHKLRCTQKIATDK